MVTYDMLAEALATFDEENFIGTPERLAQRLRDPAFSWDECPRSPATSSSETFLKAAAREVDGLTPVLYDLPEEASE
jgi:hypothetical protein